MRIILAAVEQPLADAWHRMCGQLPQVTVYHGSIFDCACDAIVSPANSFGFMDGGIDLLYSRFFGWHVQERLQTIIQTQHHGELLVGNAAIVPTDHHKIPYLIAAPTMRVPMILSESVHPYLACRAVLQLITDGVFIDGPHNGERIGDVVQTVAFPGLGTGVGQVSPNVCAHQMRTALNDVLFNPLAFPKTWAEAQARHQQLYTDRIRDLQHNP